MADKNPSQTVEEKLTDWCGKDRDLDSVVWAAAQDDDLRDALVALIAETRADFVREMEGANA